MVSNKALRGTRSFSRWDRFLPTPRFSSDVLLERLLTPATQVTLCNSPVSGEAMRIEKKKKKEIRFFFLFLEQF